MLHNETRKLLINTWNKTRNAEEVAKCFSVGTDTVYRLGKMGKTGSMDTRVSGTMKKVCKCGSMIIMGQKA